MKNEEKIGQPLISVIVPVFNVEKYLRKCLDSIVRQTYAKLEIILVDDGSTDGCGKICDSYADVDKRIVTIHKENGGLSDARNAGLDIASGLYVFFIDSDDYVDKGAISYLYGLIIQDDSDIATIWRRCFKDNEPVPLAGASSSEERIINMGGVEALGRALYGDGVTLHAWGKLYRRELFESVRFPKGRIYEDAGTTYKLFSKANKVIASSSAKYHYLLREGSIIRSGFYPAMMDHVYFAKDMVDFAKAENQNLIVATRSYLFMSAMHILNLMVKSKECKEYRNYEQECLNTVREHRWNIIFDPRASLAARVYGVSSLPGERIMKSILRTKSRAKRLIRK